jgi:hypothetical protein
LSLSGIATPTLRISPLWQAWNGFSAIVRTTPVESEMQNGPANLRP